MLISLGNHALILKKKKKTLKLLKPKVTFKEMQSLLILSNTGLFPSALTNIGSPIDSYKKGRKENTGDL